MKICIAGKNDIAVDSASYLLYNLGISKEDLLILPNDDDPGVDNWQRSLKHWALINDVEIVELDNLYEIENLFFLSLEYNRIIIPSKFRSNNLFNSHFSLLPKYKGAFTSVYPILNGDSISGVTFHEIDAGIDTGDIIAQIKFEIDINDTSRDMYLKYIAYGSKLFRECIQSVLERKYTKITQKHIGSTFYSRKSINFNDIKIDFKKTSFEIHNNVRAFVFKEYQLPKVNGIKIKKSVLTNEKIRPNFFEESETDFIISGIDGFKVVLYKNS